MEDTKSENPNPWEKSYDVQKGRGYYGKIRNCKIGEVPVRRSLIPQRKLEEIRRNGD